jgi:hypothetical protein
VYLNNGSKVGYELLTLDQATHVSHYYVLGLICWRFLLCEVHSLSEELENIIGQRVKRIDKSHSQGAGSAGIIYAADMYPTPVKDTSHTNSSQFKTFASQCYRLPYSQLAILPEVIFASKMLQCKLP